MTKNSTQDKTNLIDVKQVPSKAPKQSTISLIKQFARIYSYNNSLQPGLRGFSPN